MKAKEITTKIKIFDDPVTCDDDENKCQFIKSRYGFCELFRTSVIIKYSPLCCIKCEECKTIYKAAQ